MSEYIKAMKCHWKEIAILSMAWHFVVDWIILGLGIMIGMHIGHS